MGSGVLDGEGEMRDLPWTSWGAARGAAKAGEMRRRRAADRSVVGRIVVDMIDDKS